ncbi:cuticle protein LPCP-23-like [Galleria mellonella]|uniref:Cuticle protein LPCP-23-like n=1 Tax=Galleria mellonella TaxID=7137 RepID=A0A6J3CA82_GALME|nr:cuticle protein LPCP-23-like [Galleria mellonella]
MKSMVVLFAIATVACGSLIPVAQPPHHPAIVLDPHGRPLDTAEVINARAVHLQAKVLEDHQAPLVHAAPVAHAVVAPAVVAAPAAVSHQARIDVHSSPAIVSQAYAPLLSHAISGEHLLKKRSLAHITPIIASSAVSHQSRIDVVSSPAVVSHAIATPVISHAVSTPVVAASTYSIWDAPIHSALADLSLSHGHILKKRSLGEILAPTVLSHSLASPVVSHAIAAPVVAIAPSAVSHQSRVDIRSSPAVVTHSVVAPVHSIWNAPIYGTHSGLSLSHGHLLKKRSLAELWAPAVVSHVASPIVLAAPTAVSHQSRVDVINSGAHVVPVAHSAVWTAPQLHLSHSGLLHAGH